MKNNEIDAYILVTKLLYSIEQDLSKNLTALQYVEEVLCL